MLYFKHALVHTGQCKCSDGIGETDLQGGTHVYKGLLSVMSTKHKRTQKESAGEGAVSCVD